MRRPLSYNVLRFPVAMILLFSAVMKAYATAVEPVRGLPWFEILSVEYEFLLSFALLGGLFPRLVRWITIGTFLLFLTVALRLAWLAADSCGCFGHWHVDPRWTSILDGSVILLLFFAKTDGDIMTFPTRKQTIGFLAATLLTVIPVFLMARPHPPVIVEHLPAETPHTTEHDFDYVEPMSVHRFSFVIANLTDRNWKIRAVKTECDCLVVLDAPEQVAPKEQATFSMEFVVPKEKQMYTKKITVETDDPQQEKILYTIHARIGLPLKVTPKEVVFENIPPSGETRETTITIVNDGKEPVKLFYSKASPALCFVRVPREPIPPGEKRELPLVLRSPATGITVFHIDLILQTNHPDQKNMTLPVKIMPVEEK